MRASEPVVLMEIIILGCAGYISVDDALIPIGTCRHAQDTSTQSSTQFSTQVIISLNIYRIVYRAKREGRTDMLLDVLALYFRHRALLI